MKFLRKKKFKWITQFKIYNNTREYKAALSHYPRVSMCKHKKEIAHMAGINGDDFPTDYVSRLVIISHQEI